MNTISYPKISIVTPCYNSERYLENTIISVLNQEYPNLEYVIVDGGSTDTTLDIIKKYEHQLSYWVSEKDTGMYDALNKGFRHTTGEIMGWIGSDDMYHQQSFFTIASIFSEHQNIQWLLGAASTFDEKGRTVKVHQSKRFTREGFLNGDFKWLQQESCLWKRTLWNKAGKMLNRNLKYAGDFDLWLRFFRFEELYVTDALIAGFRKHRFGQLSSSLKNYLNEIKQVLDHEISLNINIERRKKHRIYFDSLAQKFIIEED